MIIHYPEKSIVLFGQIGKYKFFDRPENIILIIGETHFSTNERLNDRFQVYTIVIWRNWGD